MSPMDWGSVHETGAGDGEPAFRIMPGGLGAGRLSLNVPNALRPHGAAARTKLWEIGSTLHCSIIGTCLSSGELRALVCKFTRTQGEPTDHEIHGVAVAAAGKHDMLGKQIQKALDRRHSVIIKRFHAAASPQEVVALWRTAMQAGDIPGAYWAALTHPATDDATVRKLFGEVHMLSHQIGAANRADIRRLRQLEEEKEALTDKVARQERRLRDGISSRDAKIREFTRLVSSTIAGQPPQRDAGDVASRADAMERLVADLRGQLDREIARRQAAEAKIEDMSRARAECDQRTEKLQQQIESLGQELESAEARLAWEAATDRDSPEWNWNGLRILYVGGRPQQVRLLRAVIERAGGELVHHDGGVDERLELLYGLASHADVAVFPIDCVSHAAMHLIKKTCRQAGKPFVPLRSAGVTSCLHALRTALRQPLAQAAAGSAA